ncbi:MAG: hypothetical protein F6K28_46485 [Microcoleus sp. SIO2G3]|nr:hypothetical protein [Microcoleus sp. SIO2G3]
MIDRFAPRLKNLHRLVKVDSIAVFTAVGRFAPPLDSAYGYARSIFVSPRSAFACPAAVICAGSITIKADEAQVGKNFS